MVRAALLRQEVVTAHAVGPDVEVLIIGKELLLHAVKAVTRTEELRPYLLRIVGIGSHHHYAANAYMLE